MKIKILLIITIYLCTITLNAQWINHATGISETLNSIFFLNKDTGWVVGDASLNAPILKTVDGGATWDIKNSNTINNLKSIFFVTNNIGFAAGSGIFLKTIDGGESWTLINGYTDWFTKIYFISDSIGFLTSNKIYKTINQGQTWNVVSNNYLGITSICFPSDSIGYAVSSSGKIYKSTDIGNSWSILPQITNNSIKDIFFTSKTEGYITISSSPNNLALKTVDGGQNWNSLNVGNSQPINAIHFTSIDTGYFAGGNGNGELFATTNAGLTWVKIQNNLFSSHNLSDLYFVNSNIGFAVDWDGNVYKTENGGITTSIDYKQRIDNLNIYPNPAKDKIEITGLYKKAILNLVNIQCQVVYSQMLEESKYSNIVDISKLSTGIYTIMISTNEGVIVKKLIKL